ncbi:MAG: hypothetical protein ABSA83_08190 [Verrucomicrobiota bacterium]
MRAAEHSQEGILGDILAGHGRQTHLGQPKTRETGQRGKFARVRLCASRRHAAEAAGYWSWPMKFASSTVMEAINPARPGHACCMVLSNMVFVMGWL